MESLYIDAFNLAHVIKSQGSTNIPSSIKELAFLLEQFAVSQGLGVTLVLDGIRFKAQIPYALVMPREERELSPQMLF